MLCIVQGFTGSPSVLLATHKGSAPNRLHKNGRSAAASPAAGDRMLNGGKKGLSHVDLPLYSSREEQARKGSWSCHIYAWHRPEPQSWPWCWSSSHSIQHCRDHCGHAAGKYWDCGRQRSKKGLLVAVRSFPKTSWLWEQLKDAQEIDCCPSLLTAEPD